MQIQSGKSAAVRRLLDLTPESYAILAGECQVQGRGFSRHRASLATTSALNSAHDRVCAKAGLSLCLYDLRHTFATRMAEGRGLLGDAGSDPGTRFHPHLGALRPSACGAQARSNVQVCELPNDEGRRTGQREIKIKWANFGPTLGENEAYFPLSRANDSKRPDAAKPRGIKATRRKTGGAGRNRTDV